jgi:hypothetical protein
LKKIIALVLVAAILAASSLSFGQASEYRTVLLSGTADLLVDSTLQSTGAMRGKRAYINGIYAWWDNAANTNQIFIEVVSGQTAFVVQGSRRQFKYSEAMTSGGIKGETFTPNITTAADSTLYFIINATGSDSLFMAVNYKIINN